MIQIKNAVFTKTKMNFVECFTSFVNHLLPLKLKFQSESFVLFEDDDTKGSITLNKDSKSYTRFKIIKLVMEENSSLEAKQLVNYVMTRYRAMGASSFYIVIDEKEPNLINIFKNDLNFRCCGCEYLFKVKQLNNNYGIALKSLKNEFLKIICEFYNDSINSFNKMLFSREKYQFKNGFYKYVFYNENEEKILGYFETATNNYHDYYVNFVLDCEYNVYLMDAIKFIYSKLKHKNKNINLYIKLKDYFLNSKETLAILKENDLEFISKSQILAKDYYKEIKTQDIFQNTKIIFDDPTTA